MPKRSVLFICLGNICRSPIAEAIFRHEIANRGVSDQWEVDSAALGPWHVGKMPEERASATLRKFGITDYKHRVRQVTLDDFKTFDIIFGMDEDNMSELEDLARRVKGAKAKLELLGSHDPQGVLIIPDPYYENGVKPFEGVYEQCLRCCRGFLDKNIT